MIIINYWRKSSIIYRSMVDSSTRLRNRMRISPFVRFKRNSSKNRQQRWSDHTKGEVKTRIFSFLNEKNHYYNRRINIVHNLILPLLIYTRVSVFHISILHHPCGGYLPLDPVAPSLQRYAHSSRRCEGPSSNSTPHTWTGLDILLPFFLYTEWVV